MGDVLDFQRWQIVGVHLAGASVTKMTTSLGVSRAAVSKVMKLYTNYKKTSLAKGNSGWKPKLSERDCHTLKRIVTENENYCSKGDNRTQYLSWRPSSHKNTPMRTTNSTSMVELQSLNPQLLTTVLQGDKDGVMIIKHGHLMTGNM